MATDATGTPTSPDSLAKLSSSDAPRITSSGGINAIVDSIQTALNNKMKITGSPSSNQVPVWSGSAWVPSLVGASNITVGALALSTYSAASNADQTLTTSPVDVPNCSVTLGAATTYLIIAQSLTPTNTATGWTNFSIRLFVNAVQQAGDMVTPDPGSIAVGTTSKSWIATTGGSSQVAKIQAFKGAAGGTLVLPSTSVNIMAIKLTTP